MIKREKYINEIRPFYDSDLIKKTPICTWALAKSLSCYNLIALKKAYL